MNIHSFDSVDEMFDAMRRNVEAANAAVSPEQRALGFGSTVIRFTDDLIIFGKLYSREQVETTERELGADPAELEYTMQSTDANAESGIFFGRWFSLVEPEGELGSAHRVSLWPCPDWLFEAAQRAGWDGATLGTVTKRFIVNLYEDFTNRAIDTASPEGTD